MESWMEELDLSSLSPNEQQEFKNTMGDYKTAADAHIGGWRAKKLTGKPFKLPESLEKLPNDKLREEFAAEAGKLLGVEAGVTEDSIKQVNWKKGLPDDKDANSDIVSRLTDFAVKQKIPLNQIQNFVEMINQAGTELLNAANAAKEDSLKKAVETADKALNLYYGADKRKELAELLQRAMKNNVGLSAEEYEQIAEDLTDNGYIFRKPALAKVLMDRIAPLAKEGETETRTGERAQTKKRTLKDEGFTKTAAAIGLE